MMDNLPEIPQIAALPKSNGAWNPVPGAQRMSKARFRLRARIWRQKWFHWHKEHKLCWLMPIVLNVMGLLCLFAFELWAIVLAVILLLGAEIFLLVYLIRSFHFCLQDQFHNDYQMRLRDLGIPPGVYLILCFVAGLCLGVGSDFGWLIPCIGLLLVIPLLVLVTIRMYRKEGTSGPNAYGPPPDDAPTDEELSAVH